MCSMIADWIVFKRSLQDEFFDNGKMIGVVLVDFKKAFDLVDHQILINKLEMYGIKDQALSWFKTYFTNNH